MLKSIYQKESVSNTYKEVGKLKSRKRGNVEDQMLLSDEELAELMAVSVPTARKFSESVKAVRYFGRTRRNVKRIVVDSLESVG